MGKISKRACRLKRSYPCTSFVFPTAQKGYGTKLMTAGPRGLRLTFDVPTRKPMRFWMLSEFPERD
jgi:hypothetical protein